MIKELGDPRQIVHLNGIAYESEPTGMAIITITGYVTPPVRKMKKEDLRKIVEEWDVSTEGTVKQLQRQIKKHIRKRSKEHKKAKSNTKQVILSQDVQPSILCSITDSILMNASDKDQHSYTMELKSDGVAI